MRDGLGRFVKGYKPDAEFRRRLSEAGKNRPPRPDVGAKISKALTGKKLTAEHRASILACQRGKKHSEETKRRMSEAHRGKKSPWTSARIGIKSDLLFDSKNGITLCRACHQKTIRKESDFAEKYQSIVAAQM